MMSSSHVVISSDTFLNFHRHTYPQWSAVDMKAYMGDCLDEEGCDLLLQMLKYNPDERISVRNHVPSAFCSI